MGESAEHHLLEIEDSILNKLNVVFYKCLVDLDWTMLYLNDVITEVTGYPSTDFIGFESIRTYSSIICEEDRDNVAKVIAKAIVSNNQFEIIYHIINSEGKKIKVFEKGCIALDDQEDCQILEGIIIPIK